MRLIYTGYVIGNDGFFEYRWATNADSIRRKRFRDFISMIRFDSEIRDKFKLEDGERDHAPLHNVHNGIVATEEQK